MDATELIDLYCRAWSEPAAERRAELIRSVWAADATYTDPTVHAQGAGELLAHIAQVVARSPGLQIERTSRVDHHHGIARFAWHAVQADGNALPDSIDIAFFSDDGTTIERIVGFFGPLPRTDA